MIRRPAPSPTYWMHNDDDDDDEDEEEIGFIPAACRPSSVVAPDTGIAMRFFFFFYFFFVWGFPFFLSVRVYTQPSFSYYYLFCFVLCFYLCVFDHERCSAECFEIDAVSSISLSLSLSPLPSFPSFAWCAHQLLIEAWTIQTAASMTFVRETPWRRADEWYRTRHSPSGDAYPSWRKLLGGDGRRGRKDDERLTSKGVTKRLFSLVSFFLPPPPQTSNLFAGSLQVGWCARPSYLLSSKININISLGVPSVGPSVPPSVRLGDRVWKTVYYFFFAFAGNLCCTVA